MSFFAVARIVIDGVRVRAQCKHICTTLFNNRKNENSRLNDFFSLARLTLRHFIHYIHTHTRYTQHNGSFTAESPFRLRI